MTDPQPKDAAADKTGELPEEVTKVLDDLREKLNQKVDVSPSVPAAVNQANDQRESLRKSLGYTEEQMSAHEQSILKAQGPIIESLGWQKIQGKHDFESYRKEVEDELKIYPPERRTPDIMEKIFYMVKGRRADSKPSAPAAKEESRTRVSGGPGYSGAESGLPAGGGTREEGGAGDEDKLSDVERLVANKLGVSEQAYAKARKERREFKGFKPQAFEAKGMADLQLKRLMEAR